jgi:hypothetical protein
MNTNTPQAPSLTSSVKSTPVANTSSSLLNSAKPQIPAPSFEAIAKAAYAIWLSRGKEQGCDQKHWHEAELQLKRA